MDNNHRKRVEDYTVPTLVLLGVNLLWIFLVIWACLGFAAVLLTGWLLNHLITRLDHHRARRESRWPSDA